MREQTESAMQKAREEVKRLPLMARAFAGVIMAVLECINNELKEVKRGD